MRQLILEFLVLRTDLYEVMLGTYKSNCYCREKILELKQHIEKVNFSAGRARAEYTKRK